MQITLDSELLQAVPHIKIGFIHYTKITVGDSPQMLKGRLQLFQEQLFFEIEEHGLDHFAPLTSWKTIFKATGANPSRYRPSAEALYRRVAKQNYLTPIHSGVDSNNFFSLYHAIPFGLYDVDQLTGDITLAIGSEQDNYTALNEREIHLTGIPHTRDTTGAFGSPYVDSKRTAVTENTTNALQVVYFDPKIKQLEAEQLLESVASMFIQIHGGDAQQLLLTHSHPEGMI